MNRVQASPSPPWSAGCSRAGLCAVASLDDADQIEAVVQPLARRRSVPQLAEARSGAIRAARRFRDLLVGVGNIRTPTRPGSPCAPAPTSRPRRDRHGDRACVPRARAPVLPRGRDAERNRADARLGIRTVCLFPVDLLGWAGLRRDRRGDYPEMRFIASGRIGPESLRGYLQLPSVLAVAGNGLVRSDLVRTPPLRAHRVARGRSGPRAASDPPRRRGLAAPGHRRRVGLRAG